MRRPSFARRARTAGPTRGQRLDAGLEHLWPRGASRARPLRRRVHVREGDRQPGLCERGGTWSEYRTGRRSSRRTADAGVRRSVLEPEEADRARACVGADDGAEVLDELDLGLRPCLRDGSVEHLDPSGASAWAIATRSPGASSVAAGEDAANSSSAFCRPRTCRRARPRRPRWTGSASRSAAPRRAPGPCRYARPSGGTRACRP